MRCPHCDIGIHPHLNIIGTSTVGLFKDQSNNDCNCVQLLSTRCPECNKLILYLYFGTSKDHPHTIRETQSLLIYPAFRSKPVAAEVPQNYASTFIQASAVLPISPMASAALSRRLLQQILREYFKIKKNDLFQEIEEFINMGGVPSVLAEQVDVIRIIGKFAAHPVKYTNTGEIVDVEPDEAGWLLDVLEMLFDFAFVQPARIQAKRTALDQKRQDSSKSRLPPTIPSD